MKATLKLSFIVSQNGPNAICSPVVLKTKLYRVQLCSVPSVLLVDVQRSGFQSMEQQNLDPHCCQHDLESEERFSRNDKSIYQHWHQMELFQHLFFGWYCISIPVDQDWNSLLDKQSYYRYGWNLYVKQLIVQNAEVAEGKNNQ